jgi:hypothetical protein
MREEDVRVAEWLLYYDDRKAEYEKRRQDILCRMGVGPVKVFDAKEAISDPTGKKIEQLSSLENTEKWLRLVEDVEERLPWKLRTFLRLRRKYRHYRGMYGWTKKVAYEYAKEAAARDGKSIEEVLITQRLTLWRWWQRIVDYTVREAIRRGLL